MVGGSDGGEVGSIGQIKTAPRFEPPQHRHDSSTREDGPHSLAQLHRRIHDSFPSA